MIIEIRKLLIRHGSDEAVDQLAMIEIEGLDEGRPDYENERLFAPNRYTGRTGLQDVAGMRLPARSV